MSILNEVEEHVAKNHVSLLERIVKRPNPNNMIPDHICAQWHPTKNGKWKPTDFSCGSNYEATWYCGKREPCGCYHIWDAPICNRTAKKPRGCPWCATQKRCDHMMNEKYSLQAKFPEIAKPVPNCIFNSLKRLEKITSGNNVNRRREVSADNNVSVEGKTEDCNVTCVLVESNNQARSW
jgi:hypothetical protein